MWWFVVGLDGKFGDSSPNLWWVIVAMCRQAKFPRILSQNGQNDLEGPFSLPAEGIPECIFGANMVIPAQTCDELLCVEGKVYRRTDGQTDRCRRRQYPFGLKGQGVIKLLWSCGTFLIRPGSAVILFVQISMSRSYSLKHNKQTDFMSPPLMPLVRKAICTETYRPKPFQRTWDGANWSSDCGVTASARILVPDRNCQKSPTG